MEIIEMIAVAALGVMLTAFVVRFLIYVFQVRPEGRLWKLVLLLTSGALFFSLSFKMFLLACAGIILGFLFTGGRVLSYYEALVPKKNPSH